jgi:hypothetical protein
MRQRVSTAERAIADIRAAAAPSAPLKPDAVPIMASDAPPILTEPGS